MINMENIRDMSQKGQVSEEEVVLWTMTKFADEFYDDPHERAGLRLVQSARRLKMKHLFRNRGVNDKLGKLIIDHIDKVRSMYQDFIARQVTGLMSDLLKKDLSPYLLILPSKLRAGRDSICGVTAIDGDEFIILGPLEYTMFASKHLRTLDDSFWAIALDFSALA